jgi:hypothetical protein
MRQLLSVMQTKRYLGVQPYKARLHGLGRADTDGWLPEPWVGSVARRMLASRIPGPPFFLSR